MIMPQDILASIAATDSKNLKQSLIQEQAVAGNQQFFRGLKAALDPMITYGVQQVPVATVDGPGIPPDAFWILAEQLSQRLLTGNAALIAISYLRNRATMSEWNGWYRLILIKDLKAGFSETTVNKAVSASHSEYQIPVFAVQLATDSVDEETGDVDAKFLRGQRFVDTKLDGMRCMSIVYPDGTVRQYSRNGKELVNFELIRTQLSKHAVFFSVPMVLDGEVMSKSFQDLMKQARRKTDVQTNDAVLNLFDILPLSEFQDGVSSKNQLERTLELKRWYALIADHMPNVTVLGNELVNLDTAAGRDRLYAINALALSVQAEGIMIKDPLALYECKRSTAWLKMKPFIEETLTVVACEEGKADSKFVGTLGALVCEGMVGDRLVRVNCGGGYSIQLRAQLWASYTGQPVEWKKKTAGKWVTHTEYPQTNPVGLLAEVRADALTKSQDGDSWSMRFPRFKTFRGTALGEKL